MLRRILTYPDRRLRKVCETVDNIDDNLRALAADMLETMYEAPGIGLAAPQIGVIKRIIVLDCENGEERSANPIVMFNPEIVDSSNETNVHEEGCLSIPEEYADVTRPKSVAVRWTGGDGEERAEVFDGLWATCVQHEIDHLNGKLFIDRIGPVKRQMIIRRMNKLKRERDRK